MPRLLYVPLIISFIYVTVQGADPKNHSKQPEEELLDKLLSGHESSPTLKALAVEWPEFKKKYKLSYNSYDEEQKRFLRFTAKHGSFTELLVAYKLGMSSWRPNMNAISMDDVPMKVMQGQSPLPPPNPGHLAIEKAELEKSSGRPGARNSSGL
uniref:Cathepsin propeptide inhibitor domain-containing protein n=1 Tax=Romanomermis culicivorax TaxID=13658 RepID=A0A915JWB3_ROMCU